MNAESLSTDQRLAAEAALGYPGRMISHSKSGYDRAHPGHIVVFNANLCTRSQGKIWYGDIDVTKDEKALQKLAAALGEEVFVLREHDARFQTEADPRLDQARAVVSATEVKIK